MAMNGAARRESAKKRQGRLHFVPGVNVAGFLSHDDAVRKCSTRVVEPPEAREELAELEVARNVLRMSLKESLEVFRGCGIIPELHAFQRQTVPRKRVAGFFSDELLEHFAARLLRLGHRMNTRIIFTLRQARQARNSDFAEPQFSMPGR